MLSFIFTPVLPWYLIADTYYHNNRYLMELEFHVTLTRADPDISKHHI